MAATAMALLSLYPQIDLWAARGAQWEGAFASQSYDEEIYAAYVNNLAQGRPRRTLPLEIAWPGKKSFESFYSIQFIPAYLVAYFVRITGFTVSDAFILLSPLIAYLSTLLLFYLLLPATGDERFAAVSAIGVLVFGTLAARHSVMLDWFGVKGWYGSFLFLRRYTHAVSFAIFLSFIVLIWQAFRSDGTRALVPAIGAGVAFGVLIFSYFYMWTAALAWLVCMTAVWLLARREDWRKVAIRILPTILIAMILFPFYARLLSQRDFALDQVQILKLTHAPSLHRAPIWISIFVLGLLLLGLKRGWVKWRDSKVLLAISLALMPIAVFNQQVITGRTLQPDHYEMFSANYVALLSLALGIFIVWQGRRKVSNARIPNWVFGVLAGLVIGWGLLEMVQITRAQSERNIDRDRFVPVAKRLTQLGGVKSADREVVFSPDIVVVSENISALTPHAPFFSMTLPFAGGVPTAEWRTRYFQYLYYTGVRPEALEKLLLESEMVSSMSTFGYDRYNSNLTDDFKPITRDEIKNKVEEYAQYAAGFGYQNTRYPRISYLVVRVEDMPDLSNFDRYYRRDAGELFAPFILYKVQPMQ